MEYIELDYVGFGMRPRYTYYPSGDTLVRQPYMSMEQWAIARIQRAILVSLNGKMELKMFGG